MHNTESDTTKFNISHLDTDSNQVMMEMDGLGDHGVSKEGKHQLTRCDFGYKATLKDDKGENPRQALTEITVEFVGNFYNPESPEVKHGGAGTALKSLGGEKIQSPVTFKEVNNKGEVVAEVKMEGHIVARNFHMSYGDTLSTSFTLYAPKTTVDIKDGPMKGKVVWDHGAPNWTD